MSAGGAEREAREWLRAQAENQRFSGDFRPDHVPSLVALLEKCANEARLEALEQAKSVLLASRTYHSHIQVCWCERCAYVRANVTEINVLAIRALKAAQHGEKELSKAQA